MLTKNDLRQIGEVMDDRLVEVLDAVNKGFSGVQGQIHGLKQYVSGLTQRVTKIEATMVTKSYLDDKLAPINGKMNVLVDVLHRNGTISDDQRRIVHS